MAQGWEKDKTWSDKFIPAIKHVLGEVFVSVASIKEDQMRNTDLICYDLSGKRIACRVRQKDYVNKYPFQFTIRSSRPYGNKTELQKIEEGWGDYFFYGFSNNTEDGFLQWLIGDLNVFRQVRQKKSLHGHFQRNADKSSNFMAFDWGSMPPEFFIGISDVSLRMNDVCDYCFSLRKSYNGQPYKQICSKCLALYDYNLVIQNYNQMRQLTQVANNA